jgi:hypothetical protein
MMITFLFIWLLLGLISLLLMALTDNCVLYFIDLKKFLVFKNLMSFILSLGVLFVYLPLTILHLISEVFKNKK